jgi:hypothetical protein
VKLAPGFYWYLGPEGHTSYGEPRRWRVVEVDEDGDTIRQCGTEIAWDVEEAYPLGQFIKIDEPPSP